MVTWLHTNNTTTTTTLSFGTVGTVDGATLLAGSTVFEVPIADHSGPAY